MQTKIYSSSKEFVENLQSKTAKKAKAYRIAFWTLTLFVLLFGLFSTIMGVMKLGASKNGTLAPEAFKDTYSYGAFEWSAFKSFTTMFVKDGVDQWPIFTLWIGIAVSILNGLIALFLVRPKANRNQKVNNMINLELKLYNANAGKYEGAKNKDILLFETVSSFVGTSSRLAGKEIK